MERPRNELKTATHVYARCVTHLRAPCREGAEELLVRRLGQMLMVEVEQRAARLQIRTKLAQDREQIPSALLDADICAFDEVQQLALGQPAPGTD